MPTLTDRHFALKVLFSKITCRDDWIACGDPLGWGLKRDNPEGFAF
jgi:hypothetical protein